MEKMTPKTLKKLRYVPAVNLEKKVSEFANLSFISSVPAPSGKLIKDLHHPSDSGEN